MVFTLQQPARLSTRGQAVYFHARERRRSLAGVLELHRTHDFRGATAIPVPTIDTGASFPERTLPVTFQTSIRITPNAGQHRGLVFEFGDAAIGAALWVGDNTIGFHAGEDGDLTGATALFDNTAELPPGLELDLAASVIPGTASVRLWANGRELARATAITETFGVEGTWAAASNGSFASAASGAVVPDVPAISQGAPAGFEVIERLSVYQNQRPRNFN